MTSTPPRTLPGLDPSLSEVVARLRTLILEAAPDLLEDVGTDRLAYGLDGPVCFIHPCSTHVELGFARGKDLAGIVPSAQGPGSRSGAIKIHQPEDIWPDLFKRLVRQAVALARWGAPRWSGGAPAA